MILFMTYQNSDGLILGICVLFLLVSIVGKISPRLTGITTSLLVGKTVTARWPSPRGAVGNGGW